jgi:hypothetical protein
LLAKVSFALAAIMFVPSIALAAVETEDVFAVVISIEASDGEYAGYYCPPLESEDDICHGASILIQRGAIERFVDNRPNHRDARFKSASRSDVDSTYYRLKMIGGHAQRRLPAGRYLAIIEPTNETHIFVQWYEQYREAEGCFSKEVVDHYKPRISFDRLKLREDGSRCL